MYTGPGPVAQLANAWSQYTKAAGSISGQGAYKSQSIK